MLESILIIVALLLTGVCVGIAVLLALLWFSVDKD